MKNRLKAKLVVTCTPEGVLKNFSTKEEIERQKRRREFFKFGGTAQLYLFSISLRKEIDSFRRERHLQK